MKQLVFMKGWYGFENDRYRRNKLALTEDQQIVFPSMLEYFLEFLQNIFNTGVLPVLGLSEFLEFYGESENPGFIGA